MLTPDGSRNRQQRLREQLDANGIDAAVISDARDVYYFTGFYAGTFPTLLYVEAKGGSWLLSHTAEPAAVVDERLTYEYHRLFTMNPDPVRCLGEVLRQRIAGMRQVRRLGWQSESLPHSLAGMLADALAPGDWPPIDSLITDLQQRKDPDEVALLRKAIACSLAAYDAAAAVITPGVSELEVLEAAHRAATLEAGEPIHFGGDFRCAEFGGPARPRLIEAGELYIIDAQSTYRGYWSDLARTFAVSEPTELQQSVYDHLAQILSEVPQHVQPGASCTAFWHWLDQRIREHPHLAQDGLVHHGGHGVGTRGHEAPDLNRDRDATFAVGNVFSCEPGGYSPTLRTGIRLENTFLVTEKGVENLSPYPLDLRAALRG